MFSESFASPFLVLLVLILLFSTIAFFILYRSYKSLYADMKDTSLCLEEKYTELQKKYNDALKSPELKKEASLELKEFLNDLTSGEALVSISRVDPSNVFLYSPRDKK